MGATASYQSRSSSAGPKPVAQRRSAARRLGCSLKVWRTLMQAKCVESLPSCKALSCHSSFNFSLPFPQATPSQPTPQPPKGQVCLRLHHLEQPSRSLLLLWPPAPGSVPIPSAGRLKLLPATAFRAAALGLDSHRTQVSTPCVFIERVHVAS